jgi:hypothetical protein
MNVDADWKLDIQLPFHTFQGDVPTSASWGSEDYGETSYSGVRMAYRVR